MKFLRALPRSGIAGRIEYLCSTIILSSDVSSIPAKKFIHGFSDASQKAYACSTYIRAVYSDASVTTTLITAKTKIAPLRSVTIPKLELCAAHLLAHINSHLFDQTMPRSQVPLISTK